MNGGHRGYILVEGQGDQAAVANLVVRLWTSLGLPHLAWVSPALRWPKLNTREGVQRACNRIRAKGDVAALLVTRDEDDDCPRDTGPETAGWIETENLQFPTAVLLFHREYEALFLACMEQLAGRRLEAGGISRDGIIEGARFEGNPEDIRGAKGWVSRHMPRGRSYKETVDQLLLTQMLDLEVLRGSGLPCFSTLERCLIFLGQGLGQGGAVYPPPR